MQNTIKEQMKKYNENLSIYACKDDDVIRFQKEKKDDIRTPFFRDIDRIIYSLSYTRYMDKTQVFSFNENDHISKRMIHVQFVSKIARTIGRALGLNEDLIEAAALGHDLGHVPFGHVGEKILNDISLKNNEGTFNHNIQSVRELMTLENGGKGKNISLQVLDAIMCHNGEFVCGKYEPVKKTKEEFLKEYYESYNSYNSCDLIPCTLEGCVVRISDLIAYIGRDIEDAIRLGIIDRSDIPKDICSVLGNNNKDIINTIVNDIINESFNKPYIKLSDKVYNAISKLKDYNYVNIYDKANSKESIKNYEKMFNELFSHYVIMQENHVTSSSIYVAFIDVMDTEYLLNNSYARIAIDYIAGMTDDYFIKEYNNLKNVNNNSSEVNNDK